MELSELAAVPDEHLDLLTGAILIARDAYPALDVDRELARMAELAAPLVDQHLSDRPGARQADAIGAYLFEELGFRGNDADYYDPRNSFLNDVLDRRLGIPITLGLVYMEVARRAGVVTHGVNFPGHYLVRIEHPRRGEPLIVDPFNGGALLDRAALAGLLERTTSGHRRLDASMIAPASARQTLLRMLMNLRAIYATRADYARLLVVLDRIVDLSPDAATEVRDRGLLSARLGALQAAVSDLRAYVRSAPHAGDVAEVRRIIDQLELRGAASAPN